jgi:hypothetical protein
MAIYYVNDAPRPNQKEHEVHKTGCSKMPNHKTNLGEHATCQSAVAKAKTIYTDADGCALCCSACHTK